MFFNAIFVFLLLWQTVSRHEEEEKSLPRHGRPKEEKLLLFLLPA
jgi:hypothetical protein